MPPNAPRILEFGPFRLNPSERTLHRGGELVSLTPKVFDLLYFLSSHAGRLITKEEILSSLWADTIVEESNLSVNISTLRRALGENPAQPVYIETVPKRGYRFLAEVRGAAVVAAVVPAVAPMAAPEWRRYRIPAAIAILVAVTVLGGAWILPRGAARADLWRPVPLTAMPGIETTPALSPDGEQVLYAAPPNEVTGGGTAEPEPGLWLQRIGSGVPVRLTNQFDLNPAWSPDGRQIAFVRVTSHQTSRLVVRPLLSGPERVLAELRIGTSWLGPYVSYSPDGEWLLTSMGAPSEPDARRRLVAVSRSTGQIRPLLDPVPASHGDLGPVLSPKGDLLAFSRCQTPAVCSLYTVPMRGLAPQGTPTRVGPLTTPDFRPVFLPDGSILHAMGAPDVRSIWRTRFDWRGRPHHEQLSSPGEDATMPTVAVTPRGLRLVYVRNQVDLNPWRLTLDSPDGHPVSSRPFVSSTRPEETPAYSPDGTRIAFASARTGQWEIWVCNASNESDCYQLSRLAPNYTRNPTWTPDGQFIIFDSRENGNADLYIAPSQGGEVRRLTHEPSVEIEPHVSPDGRWLYFASNRTGRLEIYRQEIAGSAIAGEPKRVTQSGGILVQPSTDGRTIDFRGADGQFYRQAADGSGNPTLLLTSEWMTSPAPAPYGKSYAIRQEGLIGYLSRLDTKTQTVEKLHRVSLFRSVGLTRSPDGRQLVYIQTDRNESDLMMIDTLPF